MGLLLVYGLNTWLPQLMASAGYTLNAGLALLLVLNVGAVVGLVIAGILADRHGTKKIVLLWFGLSAVFLAALSIKIQNEPLLNAAVFVTGVFVFSSQVLVYAWVSQLFPARLRGTALGFAAGVGRLGAIWARPSPARWSPPVSPTRGASTSSPPPPSWRSWPSRLVPQAVAGNVTATGTARRALLGVRQPRDRRPEPRRPLPQPPPGAGREHDGDADGGTDDGLHDPVPEQDAGDRAPPAAWRSAPAA